MANNQKKLKAFVRYDGSGRVVASSLILRKNKPRVGRWFEIPEYLCCNGTNPSSTTTTTTNGGGGGTPTAWAIITSPTPQNACAGVPGWLVYTSQSTLGVGVTLYYDALLTQPWEGNQYISYNGTAYNLSGSTIITNGVPC
jgi:hypothetical protein